MASYATSAARMAGHGGRAAAGASWRRRMASRWQCSPRRRRRAWRHGIWATRASIRRSSSRARWPPARLPSSWRTSSWPTIWPRPSATGLWPGVPGSRKHETRETGFSLKPMRIVYDPQHVRHQPRTELLYGRPVPHPDQPERIEAIHAALRRSRWAGSLQPPRRFDLKLAERIHEADYLAHLLARGEEMAAEGPEAEWFAYVWPHDRS